MVYVGIRTYIRYYLDDDVGGLVGKPISDRRGREIGIVASIDYRRGFFDPIAPTLLTTQFADRFEVTEFSGFADKYFVVVPLGTRTRSSDDSEK